MVHVDLDLIERCLPGTTSQIAAKTDYTQHQVWRALNRLRGKRRCYVCKWLRGGSGYVPVWAAGDKPDAVCKLRPLGRKSYNRRYYEKRKLEKMKQEKDVSIVVQVVVPATSTSVVRNVDPLFNALFGR